MVFKDIMINIYVKFIFNLMNFFRKSNIFCDVILRVEQKDFFVYWIVLVVCSDYFCVMFISEFLEKGKFYVDI